MIKNALCLVFMVSLVISTGCSRAQKVVATPLDATVPHEEIGVLEVFMPAKNVTPKRALRYQKRLLRELAQVAKKNYDADSVVRVEFSPKLESSTLPDSKVYARGVMIKYKKFEAS